MGHKYCSSHMRRKFLEKEGTLTLEDLLRIARSQEAVDRQMKVMVSNAGADQVNVVGGNKRSAKSRVCYACGLDGHFSGQEVSCTWSSTSKMWRYWAFQS